MECEAPRYDLYKFWKKRENWEKPYFKRHTVNFLERRRGTIHRFKKHNPEQDK